MKNSHLLAALFRSFYPTPGVLSPIIIGIILILAACSFPQKQTRRPTEKCTESHKAHPDAVEAFAEAVALWKQPTETLTTVLACSDPETAVTLLDRAIAISPGYAEAFARRGLAGSDMGMREKAFDDVTTAIRLDPEPVFYAYRGLILLREGRPFAAKSDLDYSLQLNPAQDLAHNLSGVLALSEGNIPAACEAFKKGCHSGDCSFLNAAKLEKICP